jgi:hypothetical protein
MAAAGAAGSDIDFRFEQKVKSLEGLKRAVDHLKAAGLVHRAAVRTTFKIFEIDLADEDIADEPKTKKKSKKDKRGKSRKRR